MEATEQEGKALAEMEQMRLPLWNPDSNFWALLQCCWLGALEFTQMLKSRVTPAGETCTSTSCAAVLRRRFEAWCEGRVILEHGLYSL